MTSPRQVLPGTTYFVSHRCFQRRFLLRPSKLVNQIFLYTMAVAAGRYGIEVHAFCVMSNHFHLVVTDRNAQLPLFQQLLDSQVGKAINALYGRGETFWKPGSYSAAPLESLEDVVRQAGYTLANPVAAGLVRKAHQWPGLHSTPALLGTTLRVERPSHYFDPEGPMPDVVTLEVPPPPGAELLAFRQALEADLAEREAAAASKVRRILGVARILKQSPFDRPGTRERLRALRPRVVAKDPALRQALIARLKAFLEDHQVALEAWCAGAREVVFPKGTYLMRVLHGATCAGAG